MKKKAVEFYIGQTTYNREGYEMMLLDATNAHNLTVWFPETGIIKKKRYYSDFLHGLIAISNDLIPNRVACRLLPMSKVSRTISTASSIRRLCVLWRIFWVVCLLRVRVTTSSL